MFKFLLVIGLLVAAGGLAVNFVGGGGAKESGEGVIRPVAPSKIQSILARRDIFFKLVEETKGEVASRLSESDRARFDLANPRAKWGVLREGLLAKGCPPEVELAVAVGIGSIDDIEFGTIDGRETCSIPAEVGVVVRIPRPGSPEGPR